MKKIFYILALAAVCSCSEKAEDDNASSKLADATDLVAEQTDLTTVTLTLCPASGSDRSRQQVIYILGPDSGKGL